VARRSNTLEVWQMNPAIALNLIGYGAVLAGGLVLGTIFGRKLASDFSALVRAMESRVTRAGDGDALRACVDERRGRGGSDQGTCGGD
jgi:hypothetical protein